MSSNFAIACQSFELRRNWLRLCWLLPIILLAGMGLEAAGATLTWTLRQPVGTVENINDFAFGQGLYVAVGDGGAICTSPDGSNWTFRASGTAGKLTRVAFAGGVFVAVGHGGTVITSPDGIAWNAATSGVGVDLLGVSVYGTGFIAVGQGGTLITSLDGSTWIPRTTGTTETLTSVVAADGTAWAAGNGSITLFSSDGQNWTRLGGPSGDFVSLTFGGGAFYLAARGDSIWRQPQDGSTGWVALPASNDYYNSITRLDYADGRLYAARTNYFRAYNGSAWEIISPRFSPVAGVRNLNGLLLAFGGVGSIATSVNGSDWALRSKATSQNFKVAAAGGGRFVAAAESSPGMVSSTDLINWQTTAYPLPGLLYDGVRALDYGGGRFLAYAYPSGGSSIAGISDDAVDWTVTAGGTPRENVVAYGDGKYVGYVSYNGRVLNSVDGLQWNVVGTASLSGSPYAMIFANGLFLMVGSNNLVASSADGTTWSQCAVPVGSYSWGSVVHGPAGFIVAGGNNKLLTSPDGVTWTLRDGPVVGLHYQKIVQGGGRYLLLASGSPQQLFSSTDGVNWDAENVPASISNANVSAFNSRFVVTGASGIVYEAAVGTPPGLASQPASGLVSAGGSLTLTAAASGTEPLSYQWYAGLSGDTTTPVVGAMAAEFTTPSLTEPSSYWVRVTNADGFCDSITANISVASAPSFASPVANGLTVTGSTGRLYASAQGDPMPSLQWYEGDPGDTSAPVAGANAPTLEIANLTSARRFWARATNPVGSVDSTGAWLTPLKPQLTDLAGGFMAMAQGGGQAMFLTNNGAAYTSATLASWEVHSLPGGFIGHRLAYGDGKFVALGTVGQNVRAAYSADNGATWMVVSTPLGDTGYVPFRSLVHGGGRFAGLSHNGDILTSTDGAAWEMEPAAPGAGALAYYGGNFYLLRTTGVLYRSSNAKFWTQIATLPSGTSRLATGPSSLVAIGSDGKVFFSSDGVGWAAPGMLPAELASVSWRGAVHVGDRFMLMAPDLVVFTADGTSWEQRTVSIGDSVSNRPYEQGLRLGSSYLIGGPFGIRTSHDRVQWINTAQPQGTGGGHVEVLNGRFFADGGKLTSLDGATWISTNLELQGSFLAYGNDHFLALSSGGMCSTSPDGLSWSLPQRAFQPNPFVDAFAFGNGVFLATGSNQAFTSVDGVHWTTAANYVSGLYVRRLVHGSGIFVAATHYDRILSSTDGVAWTERLNASTLNAVAFTGGQFIAGNENINYLSSDGINWTSTAPARPIPGPLYATGLGLGVRVSGSSVQYSGDLVNWYGLLTGHMVAQANGVFVVAGAQNLYRSEPLAGALRLVEQTTVAQETQGSVVTLSVTATGSGLTYQWYRGSSGEVSSPVMSATGASLQVTVGSSPANYWVRVIATNDSVDSATVNVVPSAAPAFTRQPQPQLVMTGHDATFVVEVYAQPAATYQWYEGEAGDTSHPIAGATASTLVLPAPAATTRVWVRATNTVASTDSLAAAANVFVRRMPLSVNRLRASAYDGSRWIVVGEQGTVVTSTDGESWEALPAITGLSFVDVAHGSGHFVAVGPQAIYSSTDGLAWHSRTSADLPGANAVTYAGGQFVAVGASGRIATSSDGETWQLRSSGVIADLVDVAGDGSRLVVLTTDQSVLVSTSGTTWTAHALGVTNTAYGVTATSHGFLIAAGAKVLRSNDGSSWNLLPPPKADGTAQIRHVTEANGQIVLAGTSSSDGLFFSSDLANWLGRPSPASILHDFNFLGGRFLATDDYTLYIMSGDGAGWDDRGRLSLETTGGNLIYESGRFVAANYQGTVFTSVSGQTWRVTPDVFELNITPVLTAAHGTFLAWAPAHTNGRVSGDLVASEAANIPAGMTSITSHAGLFAGVTSTGAIYSSTDGRGWVQRAAPTGTGLNAVVHDGVRFFALGVNGAAAYSPDGVDWIQTTVGVEGSPVALAHGAGRYVALMPLGKVIHSSDGVNWSDPIQAFQGSGPVRITFAGDVFMAGGLVSADGVHWSAPVGFTAAAMAHGNGTFVVLGDSGTVYQSLPASGEATLVSVPENAVVASGETAVLTVIATGSNLSYQWYEGYSGDVSRPVSGGNASQLTTPAIVVPRQYWVRVSNPQGAADSATIFVSNGAVLAWLQEPRPRFVAYGMEARVEAQAEGVPQPAYQWYVGNSGDVSQPIVGATSATLNRGWVNESQRVWVRASNALGHLDSRDVIIQPLFRIYPERFGQITAMATGGGRWVALGSDGRSLYSTDGQTWLPAQTQLNRGISGAAYGAGRFIALAGDGTLSSSPDGVMWNTQASSNVTGLNSAVFADGGFVVVGNNGTIMRSTDGLTWQPSVSGTSDHLVDLVHDGVQFLALAQSGALLASTDGIGWSPRNLGRTNLAHLAKSITGYLITGEYNSALLWSSDGVNWIERALPSSHAGYVPVTAVATASGFAVMVYNSGVYALLSTANGTSWTVETLPQAGLDPSARFFAVGDDYYTTAVNLHGFWRSSNLSDWASMMELPVTAPQRTVFAGGKFFIIGTDGYCLSDAGDGNWRRVSPMGGIRVNRIAFGGGFYVAIGQTGNQVGRSIDGINWNLHTVEFGGEQTDLIFDGQLFLAVGEGGLWVSADGLAWSSRPLPAAVHIRAIAQGSGKYVIGGRQLLTSTNGVDWSTFETGLIANSVHSIAHGNGRFIATSSTSTYGSDDGIVWSAQSAFITGAVVFANGTFVGERNSAFYASSDGLEWEAVSLLFPDPPLAPGPGGIAYGNGLWTLATTGNYVFRSGELGTQTAPSIDSQPSDTQRALGEAVHFTVVAEGAAPMLFQWRKGNVDLVDDDRVTGSRSATLTIVSLWPEDAGEYDVVVTNSLGDATSAVFRLTLENGGQTIDFDALADRAFTSTPITLTATASSGLAVSFAVVSGPATVSGNQLTLTGTGTVTVRAAQAGDSTYAAATSVDRSFVVTGNFSSWLSGKFTAGELLDANISGPNADPDGDGFSNLIEYALGLEPKSPSSTGLPEVSTTATDWVYTYTRPADRSELTYTVEISTDLVSWSSGGVTHELISSSGGLETWRGRHPLATAANVYFRLKVTQ